jgi:hypothetical protein
MFGAMRSLAAAALLASFSVGPLGCSGGDEETCVSLPTTCTPLYEPVFPEVFARTLRPSCALGGGACHAREGAKGGLVFDDQEEAHRRLTAPVRGRAAVSPGDPGCSSLILRLVTDDPARAMPPGRHLPEAERCAILRWIRDGAPR